MRIKPFVYIVFNFDQAIRELYSVKKHLFFSWIALATVNSSNIYDNKGQQKNVIKLTSARK